MTACGDKNFVASRKGWSDTTDIERRRSKKREACNGIWKFSRIKSFYWLFCTSQLNVPFCNPRNVLCSHRSIHALLFQCTRFLKWSRFYKGAQVRCQARTSWLEPHCFNNFQQTSCCLVQILSKHDRIHFLPFMKGMEVTARFKFKGGSLILTQSKRSQK